MAIIGGKYISGDNNWHILGRHYDLRRGVNLGVVLRARNLAYEVIRLLWWTTVTIISTTVTLAVVLSWYGHYGVLKFVEDAIYSALT